MRLQNKWHLPKPLFGIQATRWLSLHRQRKWHGRHKEIISYLNSTDDSATVVNETNSHQVFTNHQRLKTETNRSSAEQPSQDHSQKWLYIGVLALIMVIAAVFIWNAVRRRKRKTDTE